MVKVEIKRRQGRITSFTVKGHSKWAETGKDIVCAGVSALVQSAAYGIVKYLGIKAQIKMDDGFLKLTLPEELSTELRGKADAILETMTIGLYEIQGDFPNHLIVDDEGGVFHV